MAEKYSITKKEEVYNLLKNKRNFEYMSEQLLRKLIDVMKVVRFREEKILIRQGVENAFCYVIIRGCVSVYVDGKFLYKLRRTGDVFGEISFVTKSISTATIKAEKDLGVIAISYNFFNKLQSIELALWIARVLGEKLVRTSKIISGTSSEEEVAKIAGERPNVPDLLPEEKETGAVEKVPDPQNTGQVNNEQPDDSATETLGEAPVETETASEELSESTEPQMAETTEISSQDAENDAGGQPDKATVKTEETPSDIQEDPTDTEELIDLESDTIEESNI